MANNIEQVLDPRGEVEQACLVVGHKHTGGLADELRDRGYKVDDPFKRLC